MTRARRIFSYRHVVQNPDGSAKWTEPMGQKSFDYLLRPAGRVIYAVDLQLEAGQHQFVWQFDGLQTLISFTLSN